MEETSGMQRKRDPKTATNLITVLRLHHTAGTTLMIQGEEKEITQGNGSTRITERKKKMESELAVFGSSAFPLSTKKERFAWCYQSEISE